MDDDSTTTLDLSRKDISDVDMQIISEPFSNGALKKTHRAPPLEQQERRRWHEDVRGGPFQGGLELPHQALPLREHDL